MTEDVIIIELLKENIRRFDHYISTTNAKSSIILAFNGITIGSIFLKYDDFVKLFKNPDQYLNIAIPLISLLGISSIISIFFAFRVINPFLKSGNNDNYQSILFFKSISEMSYETYKTKVENSSFDNLIEDLERQSYQLAQGMTQKSIDTKRSVMFIYISLSIILILLILKGIQSFVII